MYHSQDLLLVEVACRCSQTHLDVISGTGGSSALVYNAVVVVLHFLGIGGIGRIG
jgi:hypothetical protein